MAASIKIVYRTDKAKKDGTAPLWLRIIANRKPRYVSTGIYIEPKFWNDKKSCVRATHPIAPTLNHKLTTLLLEAQEQALQTANADEVKAAVTGTGGSFTAFFQQHIGQLDAAGRFWDWKKYRVTLGKLQACFGEEINWNDFNRDALIKFERCLRQKYKNKPNTVRKEMQRVSRVFRLAMKDGVIRAEANPFLTYDRPKAQKVNRRKLSLEEIEALAALDLKPGTLLHLSRDAFVVAFYLGGARFGDVCLWKLDNLRDGRIEYRMMKTAEPINLPVPEPARRILAPYLEGKEPGDFVFPFLKPGDDSGPVRVRKRIASNNTKVNVKLKRLAEQAGLDADGISFHVARHSFADFARTRSGDLYAISKSLGHKDLQTTQTYLREFDQQAVDQLSDELWGE